MTIPPSTISLYCSKRQLTLTDVHVYTVLFMKYQCYDVLYIHEVARYIFFFGGGGECHFVFC